MTVTPWPQPRLPRGQTWRVCESRGTVDGRFLSAVGGDAEIYYGK